jgi:DNA-binding LacI/PurR family transcriptional regulator
MSTEIAPKPHKYIELAERLTGDIESGVFQPGERLPTFDKLRLRFNVAINTLDRALIELEQNGLVRREPGRGVFVAEKKSGRTGTIGLIGFGNMFTREAAGDAAHVSVTASFYRALLMQGLDSVIHEHDLGLMLLNRESTTGWDKVDGFLAFNIPSMNLQRLRERLPAKIPCVSLLESATNVSGVLGDDYNGGRSAVEHLLELGHKRIGCLLSSRSHLAQLRLAGYQYALQEAEVDIQPKWMIPSAFPLDRYINPTDWGRESVRAWLKNHSDKSPCTALFIQNDWAAIGAIGALQEAGLRVPEDVSVISFDGTEACNLISPKITAVQVPLTQIARSGLELLLRKIKSGDSSSKETIMISTSLQIRESTAPPAGE